MWVEALRRLCRQFVIVAYAAASSAAAASPLAACPALAIDPHSHAGHADAPTHHEHGKHSTPHPGDCLKCRVGACLLGVSLPPSPSVGSATFYGARIVYQSDNIA